MTTAWRPGIESYSWRLANVEKDLIEVKVTLDKIKPSSRKAVSLLSDCYTQLWLIRDFLKDFHAPRLSELMEAGCGHPSHERPEVEA